MITVIMILDGLRAPCVCLMATSASENVSGISAFFRLSGKTYKQDLVNDKLEKRMDKMKETYDHAGRELEQLHTGEKERVRNHITGTWEPAEVVNVGRLEPRSYDIHSHNGSILRRN